MKRIPYQLKIGRRTLPVSSFEQASKVYAAERAKSLEGASTFPEGAIYRDGKRVARVSYNGRVWPIEEKRP